MKVLRNKDIGKIVGAWKKTATQGDYLLVYATEEGGRHVFADYEATENAVAHAESPNLSDETTDGRLVAIIDMREVLN